MAHRVRFAVYDPTTGRRLTHHSDLAVLKGYLDAAKHQAKVSSGYALEGWVMTDGRVRLESSSIVCIRGGYDGARWHAAETNQTVEFTLTSTAAKGIPAPRHHRVTAIPNGPGKTLRTETL